MKPVNLYRIGQWFKNRGLVGETRLALVGTVVAVSNKAMGFGIESSSGSGKTVIMDILVGDKGKDSGLIEEEYVYYKDAGSETAFFYDTDAINKSKIIVFKELQKDKSANTVEAIKSLTEGKAANRTVTDVTTDGVKQQSIKPKVVMYSLAVENDHKPDAELRRRCITMATDVSQQQTHAVLDLKASLRWNPQACRVLEDEEVKQIRDAVNFLMKYDFKVRNPFATTFAKEIAKIAPDQKVRSMAEHFWDVVEGVTKVNSQDGRHVSVMTKEGLHFLTNVQDLLQALDIYEESFVRDVFSIPPIGDVVLRGFIDAARTESSVKTAEEEAELKGNTDLAKYGFAGDQSASDWYDINHLRKAIKEHQHVILSKPVVMMICRQLVDAGYLEDAMFGKVLKFQVQEQMQNVARPNVPELVKAASELVQAAHPDRFAEWAAAQQLSYQHPISGEEILI